MGRRICASSIALAATLAALLASANPAAAQPQPIGLVIGNGAYSTLPAIPACVAASQNLADRLRGLGYQVVERQDVTSGALAAAVSEFAKGMDAHPDASVFVYICGYAASMNDRPFLLPVSANIQRPTDIMTQGILAKALLDVLARGKPSRGLLALDLVPTPDAAAPALDTLTQVPAPEGVGLIAVIGTPPAAGPTALAMALATGLADPEVQSGPLLAGAKAELARHPSARIAALGMPSISRPLAVDEPPPPPAPAPDSEPPPVPAHGAPAMSALPDEGAMTSSERQRVQEALARLGYYAGRIDGLFGPETRAAIRRFQHEIQSEMTGVITGEQATRLLTWR